MHAMQMARSCGQRVFRLGHQLWREIRDNFQSAVRMSAGGDRQVGTKTRSDRVKNLRELAFWLAAVFRVHSIVHLKRKHLVAYCHWLEDKKLSPATIATKLAHVSVLCRALGKQQLMEEREKLFQNPNSLRRSLATNRDKSLEAAGVDFQTIYDQAHRLNPRVACQLALCWEFGLRVQEAWRFRPHLALRDGLVLVLWGAKGGRKRTLTAPLTAKQEALLELAKTFAPTKAESMVPRGQSLRSWKSVFYGVTKKIGLTRKQSGATPHSLRHSYANREYERVTDRVSPVKGGTLAKDDPDADRAARELVADELGHSRASIASAYIGSARHRPDEGGPSEIT
ncbi:MAG TPA: integrase domain-containing protein [Steroidobacter sp.]|uniref:tyrosine-type recombinase/integrase n=1 Tax=Steroidobacter sp. TaxID=1978227 RepID=UPI002ED9B0B2